MPTNLDENFDEDSMEFFRKQMDLESKYEHLFVDHKIQRDVKGQTPSKPQEDGE